MSQRPVLAYLRHSGGVRVILGMLVVGHEQLLHNSLLFTACFTYCLFARRPKHRDRIARYLRCFPDRFRAWHAVGMFSWRCNR